MTLSTLTLNAFYLCTLVIASPWLVWRYLRWGKNRRGWKQKLFGLVPHRNSDRPCIWFHAVSVGEVNLLASVLKKLRDQRPDLEMVISTTTETGYDLATQKYPESKVFFFPFDFTWAVSNAFQRIKPDLIALTELELWPNFIKLASRGLPTTGAIPVVVINGRLSDSSLKGYQRFRWLLSGLFGSLRLVLAQDENSATRFRQLGCDPAQVIVTGNIKFDNLQTDRANPKTESLRQLVNIQAGQAVILAGSTQLEEDLLAARAYQNLLKQDRSIRLILAPRHPERCPQLVKSLKEMGLPVQLRSQLQNTEIDPANVLVIDVIGELSAWWGVADVAYVGGSMGTRGGQNMIEPAAYAIPVSFGPHTENFRQIVTQLLDEQAATVVHDQHEMESFFERAINDQGWANRIGNRAQSVVLQHNGAASKTAQRLNELLLSHQPAASSNHRAA